MKKHEKTLIIAASVILSLSFLSACGSKTDAEPEEANITQTETVAEETPEQEPPAEPEAEPEPEPVNTETVIKLKYQKSDIGDSFEYVYDDAGQLIAKNLIDDDGSVDTEAYYKYEYDDNGRIFRELRINTDGLYLAGLTISNVTDDQKNMIMDGYTDYTEYGYDDNDNVISETNYYCSTFDLSRSLTFDVNECYLYTYNEDGTMASKTWITESTGVKDSSLVYTYAYDENGVCTEVVLSEAGSGDIRYEYKNTIDENGNLITYIGDDSLVYNCTYDDKGNMLTKESEKRPLSTEEDMICEYTDKHTYEYDSDGNMVSDKLEFIPDESTLNPDYSLDDFHAWVGYDETITYVYEGIEVIAD